MSVRRPFIWTCNVCGKEQHKLGYGLPKGWIWYGGDVLGDSKIKHKCDTCSKEEKDGN